MSYVLRDQNSTIGTSSTNSKFRREMATKTILLNRRTLQPDEFFKKKRTKKGFGLLRHDKDPGNRDPQERISEILFHPAKREAKRQALRPPSSKKLRESGSRFGRSRPITDNGA